MAADQADTIVGANVELKGSLHNQGSIQVHGKVIGDISSSDGLVSVGETASVSGPIIAKQVDISGQVSGSISAEERIELQPGSTVKGDLVTKQLIIKPGAIFNGKIQMSGSPVDAKEESPEEGEEPVEKKRPRLEVE